MSRDLSSKLAGRTLEVVRRRFASASVDRENAVSLYRELLARPYAARREAVENDETFASPGLAAALLERAEALLDSEGGEAGEAGHLAGLAATIGDRLPEAWTLVERESIQGRARSLEGEALRQRGDLAGARKAQHRSFHHLEALPSGCGERAGFCRYLARLRRDQGRDEEALALLARALERYERQRDGRRARLCRLELAWMLLDDLETEAALALFEKALGEEGDDRAGGEGERFGRWLSLRHGLALAYADLRREAAAGAVLSEIAGAAAGRRGLDPLRIKRVQASVLQRLDANEEAAGFLFAAWSGFSLAGAPYDAALALVEFAQLRAEEGSVLDLGRLKEGVTRLAGLPPSARQALRFGLDFALRHGIAAVEILEALKLFVERVRRDPEARFSLSRSGDPVVAWEEADDGLRERLRVWSGLEDLTGRKDRSGGAEGAEGSEGAVPFLPAHRQQLAWTAAVILGARLVFASAGGDGEAGDEAAKGEGPGAHSEVESPEVEEPEPVH